MLRKIFLENKKGQRYNLNDLKNSCFFENISGLGYSYLKEYKKVGTTYVNNTNSIEQSKIQGELVFYNYDEYFNFILFTESSTDLKLVYMIATKNNIYKEYYRDIDIECIMKSEKKISLLHCPIIFICKTLWYEKNKTIYTISPISNELRWDFRWDSKFSSYDNRNIIFENKGHTEAPFLLEINGYVVNPKLTIYVDGLILYEINLKIIISENEKLLYSTNDNDLYIYKANQNGNITNLFNKLDLTKNNFFKLPKGACEIILSADNDITSAVLTIFVQYISV